MSNKIREKRTCKIALSEAVTIAVELVKGLAGGLLVVAGETGGDGDGLLELSCSDWTLAGDLELRRTRRGASDNLGDGTGSLL
jgi:hypothetical protein